MKEDFKVGKKRENLIWRKRASKFGKEIIILSVHFKNTYLHFLNENLCQPDNGSLPHFH